MLNGLSLFSGIGGIDLALSEWVTPVLYCERERYAQGVLLSRMSDGQLPVAPIWDDVRTLHIPERSVDIVYGGFPCQDISCAGLGAGLAGERSGLFFEIIRLTEETRPKFVFLENVPAIRTRGLREVIRAFTDLRYDCRWACVSAAEVGAPHLRKRWFLFAYSSGELLRDEPGGSGRANGESSGVTRDDGAKESLANTSSLGWRKESQERSGHSGRSEGSGAEGWASRSNFSSETLAYSDSERLKERNTQTRQLSESSEDGWWSVEPDVGRVADGIPARVDRLRGLGNSVVPAQAKEAFKRLSGLTLRRTK